MEPHVIIGAVSMLLALSFYRLARPQAELYEPFERDEAPERWASEPLLSFEREVRQEPEMTVWGMWAQQAPASR